MASWKMLRSKLRSARRFSVKEWRFLIIATLWLTVLRVSMPLFGFRRCVAAYGAKSKCAATLSLTPKQANTVQTISKCVQIASRNSIFKPNCLRSSLVLWRLLSHHGIPASLRIGVRDEKEGITAHAWIELNGAVLNDRPDVANNYLCFEGQDNYW